MLALLIPGVGLGGGTAVAPSFIGSIPNITWPQNSGSHAYALGAYFSSATSYSIAPAIEAGWTFNTTTADFSVDTDAAGVFGPYVVTGTNTIGSADSNGFTVTVTLAASVAEEATGGWNFYVAYEQHTKARRKKLKEQEQKQAETQQIQDRTAREIAELLRKQEAIDERRAYLERLGQLAKEQPDLEAARAYSDRVAQAYQRAIIQGNYSALEALDRELQRASEEEEFMLQALLLLTQDD
jgi:hypothetical protein